ncbi:MAG: ankyrin repeat domain-containing protein [Verrucomicrobiae bacterium]|nr:ankyrin repeat domain-containing protein [Verrucomicrobiae bacterium]
MATNSDFAQAVSDNAVSVVRDFLRQGECPSDYVCFLAVRHKANSVLRILIEAGADLGAVEHPKGGGCTLLMRAIYAKNRQAFRMLLKAGASINKRGSWEYPIHIASQEGSVDFTKACIAAGAKLDLRDSSGNTPLMAAARFGRPDVVKLLLKAGANPRVRDRVGQTAYEIAEDSNEPEVVRLLEPVSQRKPPRRQGVSALFEAVSKQDMGAVEKCLAKGVDVNARDRLGRSPLEKAIALGAVPFVRRLIEAGLDLNKVDPEGTSFLEGAMRAEQWEIAKLLLCAGAVPNPLGNRLGDPIQTAIYSRDVSLLELLVSKGSNPRTSGLLISAARAKRVEMVRYLLSKGADANEQDSDGWTPLFWALFNPLSLPGTKSRGRRIRPIGATPAAYPKLNGQKEMVKLLIKHGADLSHVTEKGETALTLASSLSLVRLMKNAGAKPGTGGGGISRGDHG